MKVYTLTVWHGDAYEGDATVLGVYTSKENAVSEMRRHAQMTVGGEPKEYSTASVATHYSIEYKDVAYWIETATLDGAFDAA